MREGEEGGCRCRCVVREGGAYVVEGVCSEIPVASIWPYLCKNQAPLLFGTPHVELCHPLWTETHALLQPQTHTRAGGAKDNTHFLK